MEIPTYVIRLFGGKENGKIMASVGLWFLGVCANDVRLDQRINENYGGLDEPFIRDNEAI